MFFLCRNTFHESVKQIGSAQHQGSAGGLGTYESVQHFNDIKEHLHMVKRDVEHLVQRSAQVWSRTATGADQKPADRALCPPQNPAEKAVKCPELPPAASCLSTIHFIIFIVIQSVLFFCYIMYKYERFGL